MKIELDSKEMRAVYAEGLIQLAKNDERIILCESDLMGANGTKPFKKEFPERTFDVGIAEANMIGVAAGLAASGKIPFANSFTPFATRRCLDQVTISCAYANLPVKIGGTDPGICAQLNGGTHMSVEDVALMRAIPNMTVFEPVDAEQLRQALPQIAYNGKPTYIRIHRTAANTVFGPDYNFELGKADVLRDGTDTVIFCTGIMVIRALQAAELLEAEGISAAVVNVHTVKPLDEKTVLEFAAKTRAVVTAENHSVVGALGGAVAELLSEKCPTVMRRIGIKDRFGEVGKLAYLEKVMHMTPADIVAAAKEAVAAKA
ncbi:MAG: transketolase C-terminal domain-containing protein [Clostridiales bacterium]|nr:transketolase C-terminal domain-containing protein [Clostridiales bacterium]